MLKDWRIATKAYTEAQAKKGRVCFFRHTSLRTKSARLKAIQTTALELDLFLDSPSGKAALALLYASEKSIIFGQYKVGRGYNTLYHEYYLNGTGLYLSVAGLPYTGSELTEQVTETRSITSEEAVYIYSKYTTSNITGFMSWLRAELDKIAAAAPQPTES